MSGQSVAGANSPVGRGLDLEGERFGELTAIRIVEKGTRGNVWLMRCDCGRLALRSASQLGRAIRLKMSPCCRSCLSELRGGFWTLKREKTHQRYLELFERTGRVWTWSAVDFLCEEVGQQLELAGYSRPALPIESELPICGYDLADHIDDVAEAHRRSLPGASLEAQERRRQRAEARDEARDEVEQLEKEAILADMRERGRASVAAMGARQGKAS